MTELNSPIAMNNIYKGFKEYFNLNTIFLDVIVSQITGLYCLDICKLDEYFVQTYPNYNEDKQSLREFITNEFGIDASTFILSLMK